MKSILKYFLDLDMVEKIVWIIIIIILCMVFNSNNDKRKCIDSGGLWVEQHCYINLKIINGEL